MFYASNPGNSKAVQTLAALQIKDKIFSFTRRIKEESSYFAVDGISILLSILLSQLISW